MLPLLLNPGLITHSQKWSLEPLIHSDRLDPAGKSILRENHMPVVCRRQDAGCLRKNKIKIKEIIDFIRQAPHRVIANHLEALNHCPTTRVNLRRELEKRDLLSKTVIPDDGETLIL